MGDTSLEIKSIRTSRAKSIDALVSFQRRHLVSCPRICSSCPSTQHNFLNPHSAAKRIRQSRIWSTILAMTRIVIKHDIVLLQILNSIMVSYGSIMVSDAACHNPRLTTQVGHASGHCSRGTAPCTV